MNKSDLLSPQQALGIENLINAFALGKVTDYASLLAHNSSYLRERHYVYTILNHTILYYTILTVLYYTILYFTILYYTVLYYTILYY